MQRGTKARIVALSAATGATAILTVMGAAPASADTPVDQPATFTSVYTVAATPNQVIGPDGAPKPGEPEATGTYNFMINSDLNTICYDITLTGVTQPYQSAAKTAAHIHAAAQGKNGPPRIAFPNPEGSGTATSSGCIQGPFTTGLEGDNGIDTGEGFSLKDIEANPAGFSADTHTSTFVPGAVRGQLTLLPMGGADTGATGTPIQDDNAVLPLALGTLGAAALGTTLILQRRTRTN